MIEIDDMRERHANSIRNTATGRALGLALEEIERLRTLMTLCIRVLRATHLGDQNFQPCLTGVDAAEIRRTLVQLDDFLRNEGATE